MTCLEISGIDVDIPLGKFPHLHTAISPTGIKSAIHQADLSHSLADILEESMSSVFLGVGLDRSVVGQVPHLHIPIR